jgi:hypothetical protein
VHSCTSEQEKLPTHGRILIKQCMSTIVPVLIQCIEQTDGVTVYTADKQCSCSIHAPVHNHVNPLYMRYGTSQGKDKRLRDEVIKAVLLNKHVIY